MFELTDQNLIFFVICAFVFGACLGSFANVVIVRLPSDESVVHPSSHCRSCKAKILWFHNIPILSYLVLRGRCSKCQNKFSSRYFWVELIMALLFAAITYQVGIKWSLLEYLVLVFGLVTVSFIDLDHYIIPDSFSLSGIAIGLLGSLINPERDFWSAMSGVLMGGGFLWLVAYLYWVIRKQEGMGGGDIKLLAWIGSVLSWPSVPFVILSSSVIGSLVGLIAIKKGKDGLQTVLPFGPFLALGSVIYLMGGYKIAYQYLVVFFPWLEPFDI